MEMRIAGVRGAQREDRMRTAMTVVDSGDYLKSLFTPMLEKKKNSFQFFFSFSHSTTK